MKIPEFAVRRPVTIAILVGVLLILGYVSLSRLAVDFYPDMKFPVAAVITSYSGAGPEEVESQVSEPIESILGTMQNVKEIQSSSMAGSSIVLVWFNWGTDMDFASLNMREKVAMVENYLPDGAEKPTIFKMDPSMMPVLYMGMTGGKDLAHLQEIATDSVKPALERVAGVANVTLTGGLTREVRIEVDPTRMENYGLTLTQVIGVLRADNFNQAAGKVRSGSRQYFVRSLNQFETVDEIRNVTITTAGGQPVKLSDIADITDGYKDIEQYTRMNKRPSIGVVVQKQSDANSVKVSEGVNAELDNLKKTLPGGIQVGVVFDQADFINQSMTSIQKSMLEGAVLAMAIILVFLRSLPATLIIATSIPLSIVATFVLMYFNGMTMNIISMGGIALGIGRMVDDSIVVLESIFRHRLAGEKPKAAAILGAGEVGNAVMAATFTTVAVFLPIMFVEGIASILFKPLAMTVSFAILSSLAVALTIIPLLSSRLGARQGQSEDEDLDALPEEPEIVEIADTSRLRLMSGWIGDQVNRFGTWIDGLGEQYRRIIQWSLGKRWVVITTTVGLMVVSFVVIGIGAVGAEFVPKTDAGQISVAIEVDKGSRLEETDQVTRRVENIVRALPEKTTVFTSVGPTGNFFDAGGAAADSATLRVMLPKKSERDRSTTEIVEALRLKVRDIPGAKITVNEIDPSSEGMSSAAPVTVRIKGDNLDILQSLSNQAAEVIRKVPGTREVTSSMTEGKPEVQVKIDRQRAADYGLMPSQISAALQNAVQGSVATQYRVEGDEVDVRVRYRLTSRENITDLGGIMIATPTGFQVPLSQVATFEAGLGPTSISRHDQVRTADVTAQLSGRDLNSVTADIKKKLDRVPMPSGYTVEYVGQDKDMMESFISLAYALLLAVILVYAVMAIQYESFFIPFVIMFSVPTCFIGIVFSLAITGRSFSVPAFIGAIMLVGIAVSNAIVLVDYVRTLSKRGLPRDEAIAEAGAVRLRPVLMTALATVLALIPMALGLGEGGESQAPLATVVIGGLLASTAITLVLVPVMYTILDDFGRWLGRKRKADTAVQAG